MTARVIAVFFAVQGNKLNIKETLFIMVAWVPKATVQAAIGATALDQAVRSGTEEERSFGQTVLTISLFEIMIFGPIGALSIGLLGPHLLTQEGHHHVHIEHNIEGEVDITGNIESESESESSDDEEYETGDEPGYESLKRHVETLKLLPSIEAPEFHCCVDCARIQDHIRIECFRQMIEHEYVVDKHILTSTVRHGSGCSSESQSYMSVQEENPEASPTIPPDSDVTATELIEKKHHKLSFLHHFHIPGIHSHHGHSHHGHSHHGHSHHHSRHGHHSHSSMSSNRPSATSMSSHRPSATSMSSHRPSATSMSSHRPSGTSIAHVEIETSFNHEPGAVQHASNDVKQHASTDASNHSQPDDKVFFQIGQSTEV